MDARSNALGGEPRWVRSNLEVYSHASALNAHDWLQLVQCPAGSYVFKHRGGDERRGAAIRAILLACRAIIATVSPDESENRDEVDNLKLQVVEALCMVEATFPRTELAVMFHILLHVPDSIYRWGSARNFWCFFGERCA